MEEPETMETSPCYGWAIEATPTLTLIINPSQPQVNSIMNDEQIRSFCSIAFLHDSQPIPQIDMHSLPIGIVLQPSLS